MGPSCQSNEQGGRAQKRVALERKVIHRNGLRFASARRLESKTKHSPFQLPQKWQSVENTIGKYT